MAKRKLIRTTDTPSKRSALDLAEEQIERVPARATTQPSIPRSTDRLSISLLAEERVALEDRADDFRRKGRRDIKTSRLARIAFKLLLNTPEEEILQIADEVPNLERLRAK